jgi:hypothetical protein
MSHYSTRTPLRVPLAVHEALPAAMKACNRLPGSASVMESATRFFGSQPT